MMEAFLTSNEWSWRLARTVVQGVLGVVAANVDMLVGCAVRETTARREARLAVPTSTPCRAPSSAATTATTPSEGAAWGRSTTPRRRA